MSGKSIGKEKAGKHLHDEGKNIVEKYQGFFVGTYGLGALLRYEVTRAIASPFPGALGYALRKLLFPGLFGACGRGAQFGRNLSVRHPHKIHLGANFAIDDGGLLDARGVEPGGFEIGDDVTISRRSSIVTKSTDATVSIGSDCVIGRSSILASTGGIEIGTSVAIGSQSFIGGGRYRTDDLDAPIIDQEMYTEGPVIIGDHCWIGSNVTIMDGVAIGKGAIVGSGAVVHEDVPDYTVAVSEGHRKLRTWPRERKNGEAVPRSTG